ncbi:MAG: prepilin-type N-terminal cleavage/methylation domain-containing protein [Proteobacteria bacterium]|nr:prepilin-type N-terminal cleavage/methylation domain-containing protein [Pseudomonadota bacterium]
MAANQRSTQNANGFTLIELMIVVVIIGVIAAFAIPSYQDSIRKSKRADAKTAISDAAARMEQFYLDRKTYTNDMTDLNYAGIPAAPTTNSPEGYYRISSVAPAWDAGGCFPTTCYELRAVAIDLEQLKDINCRQFAMDSRGNKTSENSVAVATTNCW